MKFREPLTFIAVGLISLLINFAVFRGVHAWLAGTFAAAPGQAALSAATAAGLATGAGYCAGVTNGFFLNRAWTFKAPAAPGQLQRFIILNAATLLLGSGAVALGVGQLGLASGVAWFVATAGTTVLNFLGSKYWAFASSSPSPSSSSAAPSPQHAGESLRQAEPWSSSLAGDGKGNIRRSDAV